MRRLNMGKDRGGKNKKGEIRVNAVCPPPVASTQECSTRCPESGDGPAAQSSKELMDPLHPYGPHRHARRSWPT